VSLHRHSVYLTNICQNASASFGLHVERVPVAYQRDAMAPSAITWTAIFGRLGTRRLGTAFLCILL
jgi:hypothetical protein